VSLLAFPDLEESSLDLAASLLAFPDLEESSLDLEVSLLAFPDLEESSLDLEESPLDLVSIDSSRLAPALVSPPALLWVSPPAQWSPLSRSPELSPLDLWLLLAPQFRQDQSAQSPVQQVPHWPPLPRAPSPLLALLCLTPHLTMSAPGLSKNPELANPCSGGTQLLSSITQFITPSPPRPP